MLYVDQRFAKLLSKLAVRREINFVVLENQFVGKGLQKIVDVVATQVGVAVGGENLIDVAVAGGNEFENGDIEGAAAEIVASDFAGVLGGLALGIIEICGNSDNRAVDSFAEVGLGPIF